MWQQQTTALQMAHQLKTESGTGNLKLGVSNLRSSDHVPPRRY